MKRSTQTTLWPTVVLSLALPLAMALWWRVYMGHPPLDEPAPVIVTLSSAN